MGSRIEKKSTEAHEHKRWVAMFFCVCVRREIGEGNEIKFKLPAKLKDVGTEAEISCALVIIVGEGIIGPHVCTWEIYPEGNAIIKIDSRKDTPGRIGELKICARVQVTEICSAAQPRTEVISLCITESNSEEQQTQDEKCFFQSESDSIFQIVYSCFDKRGGWLVISFAKVWKSEQLAICTWEDGKCERWNVNRKPLGRETWEVNPEISITKTKYVVKKYSGTMNDTSRCCTGNLFRYLNRKNAIIF